MRPWLLLAPVALASLAGCLNCNNSAQNTVDAAPAKSVAPLEDAAPEAAAVKPRKIPTGGAEAATKLAASVDTRLAALPSAAAERTKLIEDLLLRAEIFGTPSDLIKADELTKGWSELHLARANVKNRHTEDAILLWSDAAAAASIRTQR